MPIGLSGAKALRLRSVQPFDKLKANRWSKIQPRPISGRGRFSYAPASAARCRSKRSAFITLTQAAMKSSTNFRSASAAA